MFYLLYSFHETKKPIRNFGRLFNYFQFNLQTPYRVLIFCIYAKCCYSKWFLSSRIVVVVVEQ